MSVTQQCLRGSLGVNLGSGCDAVPFSEAVQGGFPPTLLEVLASLLSSSLVIISEISLFTMSYFICFFPLHLKPCMSISRFSEMLQLGREMLSWLKPIFLRPKIAFSPLAREFFFATMLIVRCVFLRDMAKRVSNYSASLTLLRYCDSAFLHFGVLEGNPSLI